MIQIRQPKHSATVIPLDSLFAHSDGLQCRSIWDDRDRSVDAIRCRNGRETGASRENSVLFLVLVIAQLVLVLEFWPQILRWIEGHLNWLD